ncbi:Transposon Ty3-I Gag-Pol polyprotein [Vitis vinifera]|uniref:Transposon Ty3-I Gag-Pol polyprotein n=1 Tax=Vitis vinifera TaxID=29760 RepID=A0A438CXI2_VITVI|nr:Transposon Ty3-I Gag-Pol polyprotein [Vitis vinifera]
MAGVRRLHQPQQCIPKRQFPLPRIDQIVDSTAGQGMLSFLDAFSGYHQIPMAPTDEEKTAFITPHDLYCYKVMPFGLKNVGATYQRLMTKIFKPLVAAARWKYTLMISWLRAKPERNMPSTCKRIYGQPKGIEVSPDQVKAVMETPSPKSKKELQRLTGKLVALGRFIARFTDELRPFFLRCSILLPLVQGAETYLLRQQSVGRRRNKVFKDGANSFGPSKCRPEPPPLLPSPPMVVLTDQPLRNILHKPNLTGRMLQWAIELSEYGTRPGSILLQAPGL